MAKHTPREKRRRKKIERVIRLIWSSLASHLPYTYLKTADGTAFHVRCVREYAVMIKELSDVL